MYAEERQALLSRRLEEVGRLRVAQLASELEVSTETVRRDIAALEKDGLARRVHGGAVSAHRLRPLEPGVAERQGLHQERKRRIAQSALSFLPEAGGSAIFDAGTSVHELVAQLPFQLNFTAITHGVHAASELTRHPDASIQLIGGTVRGKTAAAVGSGTVSSYRALGVDVAFLGTNGVSLQRGLTTPDPDEAAVKHALIHAADVVVLLADSSKIGAELMVSFADLGDVDVIITDSDLDQSIFESFTATGVEVILS